MAIKIRRPSGRPSAIQKTVEAALVNIAESLIDWQRSHNRVASGVSQSWRIRLNRVGREKPAAVAGELTGVIYINYALFGRGAGKQPRVSAILRWMRQRGIKGKDLKSGRFKNNTAAATAIAISIGKYGTKSLKLSETLQESIFSNSTDEAVEQYLPELADETAQALVDQFNDSIGDLKNITVIT